MCFWGANARYTARLLLRIGAAMSRVPHHLYLVERTDTGDYDTYDAFVVCAPSEEDARATHPRSGARWVPGERHSAWVADLAHTRVTRLGTASDACASGIVLASFNAG